MVSKYKDLIEKKEKFEIKVIDSIDQLKDIKEQYNNNNYIYRGVNNCTYKMYTSLQRRLTIDNKNFAQAKYEYEQKLFDCLLNPEILLINKVYEETETVQKLWFDLFLKCNSHIQHYHQLSPMLDFTTSFDIALYFAFDGAEQKNDYVSLFIIDSDKLTKKEDFMNDLNFSSNTISAQPKSYYKNAYRDVESNLYYFDRIQNILFNTQSEHTILKLSPELDHKRIKAQKGLFVLLNIAHVAEKITPFEDIYHKHTFEKIKCLHIKTAIMNEVITSVTNKGITKESLSLDDKEEFNQCESYVE